VLRLASTLEQFRKWSAGSSYPAILDDDVNKTLIPVLRLNVQDALARKLAQATHERDNALTVANLAWKTALDGIEQIVRGAQPLGKDELARDNGAASEAEIRRTIQGLPPLTMDNGVEDEKAVNGEFTYDQDNGIACQVQR
jgi:type I restriction enzyme S subunit